MTLVAFLTPLWGAVAVALLYATLWMGYELIVLGVIIDSFFGRTQFDSFPLYTTLFFCVVALMTILKPYLSMYKQPQ